MGLRRAEACGRDRLGERGEGEGRESLWGGQGGGGWDDGGAGKEESVIEDG